MKATLYYKGSAVSNSSFSWQLFDTNDNVLNSGIATVTGNNATATVNTKGVKSAKGDKIVVRATVDYRGYSYSSRHPGRSRNGQAVRRLGRSAQVLQHHRSHHQGGRLRHQGFLSHFQHPEELQAHQEFELFQLPWRYQVLRFHLFRSEAF